MVVRSDTESTLPVGSCNLGMEGASAKSASQWGSSWKKKSALVASTAELFLLYPVESCSNCPDCISKYIWTPTERELQSFFHMGVVHVKNVDHGQERPQAHVCIILNG